MFFIAKLKAAFRQGENHKRAKVLKAIMESIHEEYSEANYYTNLYWIVEQLLLNDPEFKKNTNKLDAECMKKGLADIVDSCIERCKYVYPGPKSPEANKVQSNTEIVITVQGGLIGEVDIPDSFKGAKVVVKDYDIDGFSDDVKIEKDNDGKEFVRSEWS